MTTKTTRVRYVGYDPQTGECHFAVPSGWATGIPNANARLIEAAPELVAALENVTYWLDITVPGSGHVTAARDLLARVKGEELERYDGAS